MSRLAVIEAVYAAFGRADVGAILEVLADDVEWEHDSVDHGVPWLAPGRGKEHVLKFFGVIGREFEIRRFEVCNLLERGDQVVAIIQIETVIRSTQKSLKDYELHVWTFGAGDKVARFRHVVDTLQHRQASQS